MPHGCPSDETVTFRKLVSSLSLQRPSIDRYSNFLKKTTKTILYFFKKYLSICYIKNLKSIKIFLDQLVYSNLIDFSVIRYYHTKYL